MDLEVTGLKGWELMASGGGRKLERFGRVLLDRPAPQAIWPVAPGDSWRRALAVFERGQGGTGDWRTGEEKPPESWHAEVDGLTFEIRLTGFGNVGLFPEHSIHWSWMADHLHGSGKPQILNLFGYTGGASIACARAGAAVTHVDAARSVNSWAMVNARLSGVAEGSIRYLADDALKFARRESRRGRRYRGIILDPPTFGRGSKGEVWKIEEDLYRLLGLCVDLLEDDPLFILLTTHSPGVTPSVLKSLLKSLGGKIEHGEMLLTGSGPVLPAGAYARWTP